MRSRIRISSSYFRIPCEIVVLRPSNSSDVEPDLQAPSSTQLGWTTLGMRTKKFKFARIADKAVDGNSSSVIVSGWPLRSALFGSCFQVSAILPFDLNLVNSARNVRSYT